MNEKIQEWKKKYGKVMQMNISGVDYIYRGINLDEYLNLQKAIEAGENPEILTAKVGTLSHEITTETGAGIILALSDEILKISGFNVEKSTPKEL